MQEEGRQLPPTTFLKDDIHNHPACVFLLGPADQSRPTPESLVVPVTKPLMVESAQTQLLKNLACTSPAGSITELKCSGFSHSTGRVSKSALRHTKQ